MTNVVFLMRSKSYLMAELRKEMFPKGPQTVHPLGSTRIFTQRFCWLVRHSSGISQEELCELLNRHPRIQNMKSLPGARFFLPLTTEFLNDLESNIGKIIEYHPYGGGLFGIGAYGTPTLDIAEVIAQICEANRDFRRFQQWCDECKQAAYQTESI